MLSSVAKPVVGTDAGDDEPNAEKPTTSLLDPPYSMNVEEQFLMTTSSDIPDDGFVRSLIEIIPESDRILQMPNTSSDYPDNMNSSSGLGSMLHEDISQGDKLKAPQVGASKLEDNVGDGLIIYKSVCPVPA